jgi:hypothetical protein|tara:strand:+ start:3420 stop:3638 length:219 start_codon:yes stop_codon:yes gene_type:complete
MAKVRNDYTVAEQIDRQGRKVYKVLIAKSEVISTCRTLEAAQEMANKLNIDPWALDRGNTRAERVAAYNKDR